MKYERFPEEISEAEERKAQMITRWLLGTFVLSGLLYALAIFGCATPEPTVFINDKIVSYSPEESEIIGITEKGLFLVRADFVRKALKDGQEVKELREQIRHLELK